MKNTTRRRALAAGIATACVAGACGAVALAAINGSGALGNTLGGNDSAVMGTYTPYDPDVEATETGGSAIEGSEEEQLQQERIAGGAVGEVVSQNLEPLEGIVDGDGIAYTPSYGIDMQAPAIGHEVTDTNCISCHGTADSAKPLPKNHLDSGLSNDDCATCHSAPVASTDEGETALPDGETGEATAGGTQEGETPAKETDTE